MGDDDLAAIVVTIRVTWYRATPAAGSKVTTIVLKLRTPKTLLQIAQCRLPREDYDRRAAILGARLLLGGGGGGGGSVRVRGASTSHVAAFYPVQTVFVFAPVRRLRAVAEPGDIGVRAKTISFYIA